MSSRSDTVKRASSTKPRRSGDASSDASSSSSTRRSTGSAKKPASASADAGSDAASDDSVDDPQERLAKLLEMIAEYSKEAVKLARSKTFKSKKKRTSTGENALMRPLPVPAPLIKILKDVDGNRLTKGAEMPRPILGKVINEYCKANLKKDADGGYKPDDALRSALGLNKKDTIKFNSLQGIISRVYAEHGISSKKDAPVPPSKSRAASAASKKKKAAVSDAESDNDSSNDDDEDDD